MAGELGLAEVLPQRGWEALKAIGWSVQKPRPRHPASATPEEREAFKKSWSRPSPRSGPSTRTSRSRSGRPTSTASGLKPILRRVWAPKGQRPIALGHHRYKWLYVTAFVQPISGEVFWYVSNGVSKPFFAALLALFAREAGAGRERIIVLGLDNAGWHTAPNLVVPDGIRLAYLPPLLARASARRAPLARPRRATRQPVLRHPRRSRTRHHRPLQGPRWRSTQSRDKLPLVAQASQAGLISRS